MSPPTPRRTQHERTAESGERLIAAAAELIADQGYERTTVAEISLRAGYSRSMAVARFGSKDALLEALLETEWEDRLLPPEPTAGSGRQELVALVDALIEQHRLQPKLFLALAVLCFEALGPITALRPRVEAWSARYEQRVAAAVARGIADGSLEPTLDPAVAATQFVAFGIGLTWRWALAPINSSFDRDLAGWRARIERLGSPV